MLIESKRKFLPLITLDLQPTPQLGKVLVRSPRAKELHMRCMCVAAQTVDCDDVIVPAIVAAFVIEEHGEIKERFSYETPFNRTTQLSLVAYSQANYGPEAVFRLMTDAEKNDFLTSPLRIPFGVQQELSSSHSWHHQRRA